ncbi:tumor suppressor candidate 2-like [Ostrea edulis]|uniref:tumor suppressor candidate 2-like n=1 Tax=Ostrea edulis TaxID=37623 RepID=UPI002096251B|nr:tumor suppressor candidate 2-like [Ostrea edulis]
MKMGQKTSSMARKVSQSVSSMFGSTNESGEGPNSLSVAITPFVYTKRGSRFYDEDGDLAHEFYEEKDINGQTVMEQHWRNLRPEGDIRLNIPRLHVDFPVVICEAPYSS